MYEYYKLVDVEILYIPENFIKLRRLRNHTQRAGGTKSLSASQHVPHRQLW